MRALILALSLSLADSLRASPQFRHGAIARPALHQRCARVCCQADMQVMAVQVPAGMQGGMALQVQTPAGLMEVQIPDGLEPGMSFQMQVPIVQESAPVLSQPPPIPVLDGVNTFAPQSEDSRLVGEFAKDWAGAGRKDALQADVERFKAKREADNAISGVDPDESSLLFKTIDTLGTVLTYNFFIIIGFFLWFVAAAVAQLGFKDWSIITSFRSAWDWLIQPLLTTHMTLTFLSWGLEKAAQPKEEEA